MGAKVKADVLLGAEDLLAHIARGLRSVGLAEKDFFCEPVPSAKADSTCFHSSLPQRLRAGLMNAAAIAAEA